MKVKSLSRVQLFATPWTIAYQAPLSVGFSRQEYWSGLPFPSPGDFSHPGIKPGSPVLQAISLLSKPPGQPQVEPKSNGKYFTRDEREDTEGEKAYENRARDWSDLSTSLGTPGAMRNWRR